MEDSIFTRIIKGEVPCAKIYEDENIYAFLDIHPIKPGHVLVVPKLQVSHFEQLDDDVYVQLFLVVKQVARRIKQILHSERVCVRIEGFDVQHVHIHVYPCNSAQEFYGEEDRLEKEPDYPALTEMSKRLAF